MDDTHPNVNYSYSYDAAHRLVSVTDSRGNKTLSYDWSAGGLLNAITDSEGRQTSYLYDPVGRLMGITAPNGDTLAYQFDAGGRLLQRSMPNGVSARFAYNEDNSLRQVVNRDTASHILSQHDYAYDGVGQRASLAEVFDGTSLAQAYSYDELKRLTAVSASGAFTMNWAYAYDPLGNRTAMSVLSGNDKVLSTFQYDAASRCDVARINPLTPHPKVAAVHKAAQRRLRQHPRRVRAVRGVVAAVRIRVD
ncbi:MAG: hypothetical protein WAP57_02260, partial [Aquabacterium commune]